MIYFLGYIKATKGVESYMKIIIDEKAKKYLKDNKQSVFTIEVRGCSSWSGTVFKPLASVGKPYNTENFDLKKVDDFDVYIMKNIKAVNDTITVSTYSFLFMENLSLNGIIV